MTKIKLFNTSEEVGVRILLILDVYQHQMSKERIVYYDYFSLHLHDLKESKESLHPDNPNHSSEIAIKRDLINKGLELIISKGLIDVRYSESGIYYQKNRVTHSFVKLFKNDYVNELKINIEFVNQKFERCSDRQIYKYINHNIGKWTGEV